MTDKTLEQLKAKWVAAEDAYEAAYVALNARLAAADEAKCAYYEALDAQENSND